MLAELAVADAAYATNKTFVNNGRDITEALSSLKNLVTAEEELLARDSRKKRTVYSSNSWAKQPMISTSFWRRSKWMKRERS